MTDGIRVLIDGQEGHLGEIASYSVREDATPLIAGESAGAVGQVTINARAITKGPVRDRTAAVTDQEITLIDANGIDGTQFKGRGSFTGKITRSSVPGERLALTAENVLSRFNVERTAKPFYGVLEPMATTATDRINLMTNPSLETNTTNYTLVNAAGGSFAATRATDDTAYEGLYYYRLTFTGTATAAGAGAYWQFNIPEASVSYTASAYYRATRAALNVQEGVAVQRVGVTLRYYNASNVEVGTANTEEAVLLNATWVRLAASAEAPAGATHARLYVISIAGASYTAWAAGDTFDVDAALAEQAGLDTYFSGATPNSNSVLDDGTTINTVSMWGGVADGSTSVQTVATTTPERGYNATQGSYFRYLCSLVGIPNPQVAIDFDNKSVAYVGWEGNVYTKLKEFLIAIHGEVAVINDTVVLQRPRTRTLPAESLDSFTINVDSARTAQFVQANNYNSHWGIGELAFRATTEYQVTTNGQTSVEVTIPHYIERPNNPTCVYLYNEAQVDGQGQYSVLDSQGLIVEPDWWNANGGRVTVEPVFEEPTRLTIRMYGPRADTNGYIGPYKFSREPGRPAPAMDITGEGVFIDKVLKTYRTGVPASATAQEFSPTIDNIFFTDAQITSSRAMDAACRAAGPVVGFQARLGFVPGLDGQEFGYVAGSRVAIGDNVFRVENVNYSPGGIEISGTSDMTFADVDDLFAYTFADFDRDYSGLTFGQFDALVGAITFGEFDAMSGGATFGTFDLVYDGATFAQFGTYPALSEPPAPLERAE